MYKLVKLTAEQRRKVRAAKKRCEEADREMSRALRSLAAIERAFAGKGHYVSEYADRRRVAIVRARGRVRRRRNFRRYRYY